VGYFSIAASLQSFPRYMFKEERDFFFYEGIDDPWKLPLFSVCFFPANKFRDIAERMARSHQTVNKGGNVFFIFLLLLLLIQSIG
jgi:hypothetical protein